MAPARATEAKATSPTANGGNQAEAPTRVRLEPLKIQRVVIPIEGTTPLIPHRWSEKARRLMLEKQQGRSARAKHEPKDKLAEAMASCYWLDAERTQPGLPATAFKASIVDASRFFEGVTMVQLKIAVFVEGEGLEQLVPIEGEKTLREDTPRNSTGVADLRYRYAFSPWRATLHIRFPTNLLDQDSIVNLVRAAGFGGVGDWRPSSPKSKTGTFGCFTVAPNQPVLVENIDAGD